MGVPLDHIFEEGFSLDTIGNAYFLRASHTDPAGWRKLVIITNQFHIERTRAIFEWVFSLPLSTATKDPVEDIYDLVFVAAPNDGLSADVLAGRTAKEAASLRGLANTKSRVRSNLASRKQKCAETPYPSICDVNKC